MSPYPVHPPRRLGPPGIGLAPQPVQFGSLPATPGLSQSGRFLPRIVGPRAAGPTFFAGIPPLVYGRTSIPGTIVPPVYLPRRLGPRAVGPTFFAVVRPPQPLTITYTDGATGTLIFAGSGVESETGTDSQTGIWILSGTSTDSNVSADSQIGIWILAGSATSDTIIPNPLTPVRSRSRLAWVDYGQIREPF